MLAPLIFAATAVRSEGFLATNAEPCLEMYAECGRQAGRCPAGSECKDMGEWSKCEPTPEYKRLAWAQCGTVAGEPGDRPQDCGAGLFCDRDDAWYSQCRPNPNDCGHGAVPPPPRFSATCEASGDPHYSTFDGLRYSFQGQCEYRLAATDCANVSSGVEVQVRNSDNSRGVSTTEAVAVRIPGIGTFEFYREREDALLNGAPPSEWPTDSAAPASSSPARRTVGEADLEDDDEEPDEPDHDDDEPDHDDDEPDEPDHDDDEPEDDGEDEDFDVEECLESCFASGFLNTYSRASCNQMISCGQACQMRADGASSGECRSHCDRNGQSGCTLSVRGRTYNMCAACEAVPGSSCTGPQHMSRGACKAGCSSRGSDFEKEAARDCGIGRNPGFTGWYSACTDEGCVEIVPLRTVGLRLRYTVAGASHAGVTISWDRHRAEVTFSSEYSAHTCGLCGDFDEQKSNDAAAVGVTPFVDSRDVIWQVGTHGIQSLFSTALERDGATEWGPACGSGPTRPPTVVVTTPCDNWSEEETAAAAAFCGVLAGDSTGPYGGCSVDPAPFFENCMFDICHGGRDVACDAIADYETACSGAEQEVGGFAGSVIDRCGVCFGDGSTCAGLVVGTGSSNDPGESSVIVCIPSTDGTMGPYTTEVAISAARDLIEAGAFLGPCPTLAPSTTSTSNSDSSSSSSSTGSSSTSSSSTSSSSTSSSSTEEPTTSSSPTSTMTSSSTSSTRKSTEKTTTASTISVSPTSTGTSIDFTDTASKTTTETTRFKPFIIIGGSGIGDVGGRYARLDAVIDRDYSEVVASAEAGEAIAQGIESELHAADIRVWKIAIVEGSVVAQIKLSATDEPKAKALFKGCDVCIPLSDGTTVCPHLAGETSCDDTGTMLEGAESNDPGDTNASASGAAAGGAAAAAVAVAAIAFIAVRRRRADARDERDDVEAAMKLPQSFEKGPETLELPPRSAGCTMESHQYEYETPVADDNSVPLYEEPGSPDEEYSGVALDDSAQHGTCNYEDECNYAMAGGVEEEATYDFAKDNYKIDAVPEYGTASAEASPRDGAVDYAIAGGIAAIRRVSTELQDQMNSEPHYETATSFATLRREDPPDYAVAEDIKSSGRQSLLLDQEPGCEPTYDVAA